jgi:hypothetical protein
MDAFIPTAPTVRLYLSNLGPMGFWILVLLGMGLADFASIMQTWFLGYWAKQYEVPDADVYVPKSVVSRLPLYMSANHRVSA